MKTNPTTPAEILSKIRRPSFVALGLALGQVRDRRLYREHYNTFQNYCRDKLGYRGTNPVHYRHVLFRP